MSELLIEKHDGVVVADTNVVISALLFRQSEPRRALNLAFEHGQVLSSSTVRNEQMIEDMTPKIVFETIALCRDSKDNNFLELAVAGQANFLITGDADLLALHPFRGTDILTPTAFLAAQTRTL